MTIEELKDKLNIEFRMDISHMYLGYENDMPLNEFNKMLDILVNKAVKILITDRVSEVGVQSEVNLPSQEKCKWTYDEEDETYWTSCDQGFTITNGNTNDNHFKYCIYCGKLIDEVRSN